MKVNEFMSKEVITCQADNTVSDAASLMADKGFSVLPIVDAENKLIGILTESDFVGKEVDIPHALVSIKQLFGQNYHLGEVEDVYARAKDTKIGDVMSKRVTTVKPDSSLTEVVELMVAKHLKRLPVVENGVLVGIITRKDLLKAFNTL